MLLLVTEVRQHVMVQLNRFIYFGAICDRFDSTRVFFLTHKHKLWEKVFSLIIKYPHKCVLSFSIWTEDVEKAHDKKYNIYYTVDRTIDTILLKSITQGLS